MSDPQQQPLATPPDIVCQRGVAGFVTYMEYATAQGIQRWHSRKHRKGYGRRDSSTLANHLFWPSNLNRVMALLFMVGASLFVVSGYLPGEHLSAIGFATGSVFFTSAAYCQFFQAINSQRANNNAAHYIAWQPRRIDYWLCLSQLIGTVMFNVNTFDALLTLTWQQQQWAIWLPNISGSILFQISGALAIIEYCHRWFCSCWRQLGWWICHINNWGCIAFLASAMLAYSAPDALFNSAIRWSELFTVIGAVCFFSASLLLYIEDINNSRRQKNTINSGQ